MKILTYYLLFSILNLNSISQLESLNPWVLLDQLVRKADTIAAKSQPNHIPFGKGIVCALKNYKTKT